MVNPNYRVEHVAQVPRGWKVRTKMSATHMLRIAFPPGRRRRGSGKVVEIFHPINENPCALRNKKVLLRDVKDAEREYANAVGIYGENNMETQRRHSRWWDLRKSYEAQTGKQLYKLNPSTPVQHQIAIAKKTLRMPDQMVRVMGGMTKDEARAILAKHGVRAKNPGATEAAAALYESFHGKSPREIVEMQESDAARHTYTALGDLRELVIDAPAGTVKIGFESSDAVKVASAPGGKQLYFLGGNQNIDGQLGRFGSDPGKDFVELGTAVQLTYRARKSMDNYQTVDYYHDLGEETGEQPLAFYDRLKRRIFLVGGRYRVEAPGIIN